MDWGLGQYGAITVMFPAALVVAVWLWAANGRRASLEWLLTLAAAYGLVGLSKIVFKGWGIGFESLDIAVLSGHAMNTSLVVIVSMSLLARQINPAWHWPVAGAAMVWTWWFAVECVAPAIHPVSEAIAGSLVGSVAAWLFLRRLERHPLRPLAAQTLVVGLMLMMIAASLPKYNAEHMLNHFAISLSGAERPHLIPTWREPPQS